VRLDLRGQALTAAALQARLSRALGLPDAGDDALLDALANAEQPLWLVLDDFPRFPDAELDHLLNELVQASARQVRWWIASRRRPRLQLTRLLLEGELFELGASELAFTRDELGALLGLAGHGMQALEQLQALTGGWCAGVRLGLVGQRAGQPLQPEACRPLLLDYLRREVLEGLPADWQQGLFTLAQFPQFDRELCEQVLGIGEGARLLDGLLECGLFIEPLTADSQLLRVQPAQAGLLAGQLPESIARALYRKACQWFIARGNVRPALEYALKAGQPELAASLMQQFTLERLLQGQGVALLLEWRRGLPEELLVGTPTLVLLNAWASLLTGRIEEGRYYMEALGRYLPQPDAERQQALLAQYKALQGELAIQRGDGEGVDELLAEAIAELPEQAWSQRLLCALLQIEQGLVRGDFEAARELIRAAMQQAREHASLAFESLLALEHAKLLELRGELLRAESLLGRLHAELASAWGGEPSPIRGRVLLLRASLLMQRGRYAEAQLAFEEGTRECRASADPAAVWGYLGLADLQALQGAFSEAYACISDAERLMQYERISSQLYNELVLATKARVWLAQGRPAQAERALRLLLVTAIARPPFGAPDLYLRLRMQLAQALLASEERPAAVENLAAMHAAASTAGRLPLACELGFVLAEGLHAEGRHGQAKQVLLDSLTMARRLGLASVERAFAQRKPAMLRWAFEAVADTEATILLSQRELDVLKLIAQGLSNQQIGDALFISLHTVKTHAQRINFKLGVERRTQAVARAKALGLLA
jgi:ATP/maltotriose-dependent transcriptional regulator MalT